MKRAVAIKHRSSHCWSHATLKGLSGKKFAALVGIEYPTLATWASKRRGVDRGGVCKAVRSVVKTAGFLNFDF
jgi:hypothetical protein